jgi:hypothetical protein
MKASILSPVLRMMPMMLLAGALPGCLLVAAGAAGGAAAGGILFYQGELKTSEHATPPEIVAAAKTALENMYIAVVSSTSDELSGEVIGRTSTDERIRIVVQYQAEGISEVGIRVGTWGNEEVSRRILNEIEKGLPHQTSHTGSAL